VRRFFVLDALRLIPGVVVFVENARPPGKQSRENPRGENVSQNPTMEWFTGALDHLLDLVQASKGKPIPSVELQYPLVRAGIAYCVHTQDLPPKGYFMLIAVTICAAAIPVAAILRAVDELARTAEFLELKWLAAIPAATK
jgi:hypothetical protein